MWKKTRSNNLTKSSTRRHQQLAAMLPFYKLAYFAILALVEVDSRKPSLYNLYSLENACQLSGGKQEIQLRTGAAIFILNEYTRLEARELLEKQDMFCHLEVEAPSGFGFHVYLEELSMDEDSQGCVDYVQFGRDVLYITTKKSLKFCGQKDKVNFQNKTDLENSKVLAQGQRWYIEDQDNEMDIWIKIKQNTIGQNRGLLNQPRWRKLMLVVTVFKHDCGQKDLYYRQCKHTNHCIRKDFFCDLRVNCAWPAGEEATDEKDCDKYLAGSYRSAKKSSFLKPSSIPVFLIIGSTICLAIAGFVVALKRFLRGAQTLDTYSGVRTTTFGSSAEAQAAIIQPSHQGQVAPEASAPPPSYEDVIKLNQVEGEVSDKPPPYSEEGQ